MSKRRNKNVKVEETVNEVIVEKEEATETEEIKEEEEMKENFIFKIGKTAGKVVGSVKKVVTSKPAKIIGGVVIVGTALAAGYKLGKDGIPEMIELKDDDFDSDESMTEVEEESYNEPEEAVETEESNE